MWWSSGVTPFDGLVGEGLGSGAQGPVGAQGGEGALILVQKPDLVKLDPSVYRESELLPGWGGQQLFCGCLETRQLDRQRLG